MEPERNSPYWDEIVGDNWPVISPADWDALERLAREGGSALDLLDVESKRRDFDDRVRSSVGLQPVKDDMVRQGGNPQAFADALEAAADTFRDFSDLVYRTRNQILDIVENATSKIQATSREAAAEEDESDALAIRDRIPGYIAAAREDVEDVVQNALGSISPLGLPSLARIADALGQPGPWVPGHPGGPDDYPPHRPATDHPGSPRHGGPPAQHGPEQGFPLPLFPDLTGDHPQLDLVDPLVPGTDFGETPNDSPAEGESPVSPSPTSTPSTFAPGGKTTPAGYSPTAAVPDDGSGLSAAGGPSRAHVAETEPTGAGRNVTSDGADSATSVDPVETATRDDHSPVASAADSYRDAGLESLTMRSASTADPTASALPPPVLPGPAVPAAHAGPTVSAPAAQAGSGPPPIQAKPTAPPVEARGPSAVPKVTAGPAAPPSGVSTGTVKVPPPNRTGQRMGGPDDADGSDELIRGVVGAAMNSAAAPSFVLGERVNGDLVLARTLLGGVLAAGGASVVGLGWAVSVMRHQSGVSAFVTSNEGRGWFPAGLYLPREVSTPWVWEVSDGFAWEGVADPARVLAEFGLAWGRKSGARLSAVVSSERIDADLRRQLGELPMEGEVGASSAMDLSAPRPGLVDRLGLVGAPALLDRAAGTPEAELGSRCWELASDAHVRVHKAGLGSPESLGAPSARERILAALRQRREVAPESWEELRDADDLLAASMLSRRADVSRVGLGELRSDHPDGRSTSDLSALRGMVFERRCDELVLLLASTPTRQGLRDAMYAHAQIMGHPTFVEPPAPGPAAEQARRPTITAGPGR
ncbi:hypothetical protein OH799_31415 [Nocardia sp. NBC_00881]|uniref:hypothetical protein n=1 Tax=Nocardia sp. NBC_00881 TaxID=2975995 RepID=UPI00386C475A|nr:hypothetical protein OH799_31415 [Nocardia sp. NBC_00881]